MINGVSGLILVLHNQDFVAHLLFVVSSFIFSPQIKKAQWGICHLSAYYLECAHIFLCLSSAVNDATPYFLCLIKVLIPIETAWSLFILAPLRYYTERVRETEMREIWNLERCACKIYVYFFTKLLLLDDMDMLCPWRDGRLERFSQPTIQSFPIGCQLLYITL